jgi:hypothetical protein
MPVDSNDRLVADLGILDHDCENWNVERLKNQVSRTLTMRFFPVQLQNHATSANQPGYHQLNYSDFDVQQKSLFLWSNLRFLMAGLHSHLRFNLERIR